MAHTNKDKDMKKRLQNYSSPMDLDQEWSALVNKQKQLKTIDKLSTTNRYLLTALTVLLIGFLVTNFYPQDTDETSKVNVQERIEKESSPTSKKEMLQSAAEVKILKAAAVKSQPGTAISQIETAAEKSSNQLAPISNSNASFNGAGSGSQTKTDATKISNIQNESKTINQIESRTQNEATLVTAENSSETGVSLNPGEQSTSQRLRNIQRISSKLNLQPISPILNWELPAIFELPSKKVAVKKKKTKNYYFKLPPGREGYVSFELLGQGGFYSLNYARLIAETLKSKTYVQVGFSYMAKNSSILDSALYAMSLPVSITKVKKTSKNVALEYGVGATLINANQLNETSELFMQANLRIGLRFQKPNGRLFYKAELLPTVEFLGLGLKPSAAGIMIGAGVGFTFGKR